jgi:acyl-CoA synthetase (AMP-forming)/AMP-acid ligase II
MNTTEFLTIACAIVPDRTAVIFDNQRFTYEELQERVNRLTNALADLGVGRGDRVAVMQVNCNQLIETYFAAAKLDAIFTPINFRARGEEVSFMINSCEPTVFLVGGRYVDLVNSIRNEVTPPNHVIALEDRVGGEWLFYDDLLAASSPEEMHFPEGDDEDTTMLLFTAGTTGTPKGVMLTHQSFSSYLLSNVTPPDPDMEERNMLSVPLYHIAGTQAVMAAIYGGRTLVVMRQFEPVEWMELVQRERADRAMMVPTMIKQLMDHPRFHDYDLSSLEVITYGAAPMPMEVIRRAIQEFPGARFINAFGQTESASTITMLPPEDHVLEGDPEEVERKLKRLSSIGKPLDDVEVSIVDEDGDQVPTGEVGEIVASGPRIMKGYWKQEGDTQNTIRHGLLYTGDLGYQDEDGYIFLAGRAKDFIKRGGEMVSPEEVEQVLMSHPGVDDAAIIGIPDLEWGERVRAVVVRRGGEAVEEEELIEHCHQHLASFKRPESVVFVDELPRNPLGKVLKRVLREEYSQPIG